MPARGARRAAGSRSSSCVSCSRRSAARWRRCRTSRPLALGAPAARGVRLGRAEERRGSRGVIAGETFLSRGAQEPDGDDPLRPSTARRTRRRRLAHHRRQDLRARGAHRRAGARASFDGPGPDGPLLDRSEGERGAARAAACDEPRGGGDAHAERAKAKATDLLGTLAKGREIARWIVERAIAGLCAMQVGVADRALRMTARYTAERKQFDRPIGSFQAVHQRAGDAFINVEAMRLDRAAGRRSCSPRTARDAGGVGREDLRGRRRQPCDLRRAAPARRDRHGPRLPAAPLVHLDPADQSSRSAPPRATWSGSATLAEMPVRRCARQDCRIRSIRIPCGVRSSRHGTTNQHRHSGCVGPAALDPLLPRRPRPAGGHEQREHHVPEAARDVAVAVLARGAGRGRARPPADGSGLPRLHPRTQRGVEVRVDRRSPRPCARGQAR